VVKKVSDERDQALIAEAIGFLEGLAFGLPRESPRFQWAEVLAARLRNYRAKIWPID